MERPTRPEWRSVLAVAWIGLAAFYVIYAAATYTGLYEALAELQLRIFSSFDPTLTFLVLLIGLCLPVRFIAPEVWKRRTPASLAKPADPKAAQRLIRNTMLAIVVLGLAIGISAGWLAHTETSSAQTVAQLNLGQNDTTPPRAGRVIVSGRLQRRYAITVEETNNGSTTQTLYTPLTSPGWRPGEPVRYILREALGHMEPGDNASRGATSADLAHFGPLAVYNHALPGLVRSGFLHAGLQLASPPIVLDANLSSAGEGLWIVSVFAFLFAASSLILWLITARSQRLRAAAVQAEAAALPSPSSTTPPATSGPPKQWELRLGGELMAELFFESYETPWISVSVKARAGMQPFWRYFEDAEKWPDDDESIDAMLHEIKRRGSFTLVPDRGSPTQSFTLVNFNESQGSLRF